MYKRTNSELILRPSDGTFIPPDPANTDYAAYLAWVAAGNEPLPADQPDPRALILAQINAIEDATGVPRVVREFMILSAQDLARREAERLTAAGAPTTAEDLLARNIGYQKTMQVEAQIAALREQLWQL